MSTVSPGSSEMFGREASLAASDYTENDRETDRILNSLYEEVGEDASELLMTPSGGKPQVDAAETEVRKPVRSRGPSPSMDHQNFPLTFAANSTNATTSNTNSSANSRHSSVGGAGINDTGNNNNDGDSTDDESRVSAYARLDFETFTFYVQTLQVMLGRRAENGPGMVDVHLGPAKAISRRHAKIFYNFGTQRFELSVLGRNGAFVGETFVEANSTVPLTDGTRIQIGQISFTFVLPRSQNESSRRTAAKAKETVKQRATPEIPTTPISKNVTVKSEIDPELASLSASVKALEPPSASPKPAAEKAPPPKKQPKREYKPEEIPEEYREKPQHSYSYLIATALREKSPDNALTLSDIYKAIQDLFPYYKYCPHGWQNSVRHNLSSNKAFKKVSKEGKGWLWGIDEEYFLEKERQKQRAAQNAKNRAAAQARAQQQQQLAQQHAKDNAAYRAQLQAQAIERTKQQAALLAQARAESKALREQQFLKNAMKNGNLSKPISPIPPVPPSRNRSKSSAGKSGSASPPPSDLALPESSSKAPSATSSISPPPPSEAINDPNATNHAPAAISHSPPVTMSTNNSPPTTNSNISTNQTIRSSSPPAASASFTSTIPNAQPSVPSRPLSEVKPPVPRQASPPTTTTAASDVQATTASDAQAVTADAPASDAHLTKAASQAQSSSSIRGMGESSGSFNSSNGASVSHNEDSKPQGVGLSGHLQRQPQPQSYPHLQPDKAKPPVRKPLPRKSASPPTTTSASAPSSMKSSVPATSAKSSLMPPGQTASSGSFAAKPAAPQSHFSGIGKAQSQSPTLRKQQPLSSLSPPLGQSYLQSVEGISRSQTVPPHPAPSASLSSINKVNRAPEIHRQHLTRAPVASKVDSPKKTIAELAREIEINRSKEGGTRLYNPSYSNEDYTRKAAPSATSGERQSPAPAGGIPSQAAPRSDVPEMPKSRPPQTSSAGSTLSSQDEQRRSPPTGLPPSSSGYDKRIPTNSSATFATRAPPRNIPPQSQPSLRAGQSTFQTAQTASHELPTPAARNPPVHTAPSTSQAAPVAAPAPSASPANQLPGLNLSPEALKSLSVLRQKIQEVVGSANSSAVTQALAYAIAQAARNSGGGAHAIQEMLNGKNPAQLAQLLKNTLEKIKKSKASTPNQATPPPVASSSSSNVTAAAGAPVAQTYPVSQSVSQAPPKQEPAKRVPEVSAPPPAAPAPVAAPVTAPAPAPTAAPAVPSAPELVAAEPSSAPAASAAGSANIASRLTQSPEALEAMLEKAKRIQNPSPKIKQALEQLQVQLDKLRAMRRQQAQEEQNNQSQGNKRPNDDESIDTTQTKVSKTL